MDTSTPARCHKHSENPNASSGNVDADGNIVGRGDDMIEALAHVIALRISKLIPDESPIDAALQAARVGAVAAHAINRGRRA